MPPALSATLARIVGDRWLRTRPAERLAYDADALPGLRRDPSLVVLPGSRDEVIAVVRALAIADVPFVARGAGTGLSGGALAARTDESGGAPAPVLIALNRLNRILALDADARLAHVEPGVVNAALQRAAAVHGLHYAPDPSSQAACTIGGNIAENAGGPHCLKYGVTREHVRALRFVNGDGDVIALQEGTDDADLLGAFIGSEGCFGIVLDAWVRLVPDPPDARTLLADFSSVPDSARAVSAIIAQGVLPAALEIMDAATIRAVEASSYAAGLPTDAAAVLIAEVDGMPEANAESLHVIEAACRAAGARALRIAHEPAERARLWQGRKKAFGALGRLGSHLAVQDAVVPRTQLPAVLERIREIGERHGVFVGNVFHAGDGNLHPNISYDADDPDESARVHDALTGIMHACIDAGGTITGEHGVGLDKRHYMDDVFDDDTLHAMQRVRDAFDPSRRANPGKVLPLHTCGEWRAAAGVARTPAVASAPSPPRVQRSVHDGTRPRVQRSVHDGTRRLQELMRSARGRLAPIGARTWRQPPPGALPISPDAGIVQYEPGDLVLVARAGTTLAELDAATREHGQWLALDPVGTDAGTIGATIATASAGPLALHAGGPRSIALGLECITGDGRIVRAGGRVVKNVAGFDLVRLLVGSAGHFGVITEVALRLRARPDGDETWWIAGADPDALCAALHRTLHPLAAVLLTRGELTSLGLDAGDDDGALVRIGGSPRAIAEQRRELARFGSCVAVDGGVWDTVRREACGTSLHEGFLLPTVDDGASHAQWMQLMERLRTAFDPSGRLHPFVDEGIIFADRVARRRTVST